MGRSLSEITRRENRIFVNLPVSLHKASEVKDVVCGSTVDFSPRGLRVRADVPFQPGQDFVISVRNNGNEPKAYNVVWVREPSQGESVYEAGLKLRPELLD
jgi:PilZ domain